MIARRDLPEAYRDWNREWGAPFGRNLRIPKRLARRLTAQFPRLAGPFGFQENNITRAFEYPWAFFATPISQGMRVVEIGGALSGLQFVLDRSGAEVTNVDPAEEDFASRWPTDEGSIERLNRAFDTNVRLFRGHLEDARLPTAEVDRVFSISTIEHIPPDQLPSLMGEVHRILAPGGLVVLTVDLFLELHPFTNASSNRWGTNVAPRDLIEMSGFELVSGDCSELLGFSEFDPEQIRGNRHQYLQGWHQSLAQCFVLAKS